ncbi:mitochondrial transcription termination factor 3 [Musca autumnalis]|uniref:mitochondrial transcription termination factor 3 n=1 Tax=Musca autumnalis TaxID=221902 RepID=UPI003CF9C231
MFSRNIRILTKLTINQLKITQNVAGQRFLRGGRPKVEYKALPTPLSEKEPDPVEMAKKELAELTGGMDMNELKAILEPNKYKSKLPATQKDEKESSTELQHELEPPADLQPTYNLAAYVNKSELLQNFIKMGVDLSAIEKRKGLAQFILTLDMERDVHPRLLFLQDQGVPAEYFGDFITKNPLIFKVDLDDMQTRVNYLEAKRFSKVQIQRILTLNPFWLMFSTKRIDKRLGYFQKEFALRGDDIRYLSSKQPRLITYNMKHLADATFCVREEMGFTKEEIKVLLLSKPRLWMLKPDDLIERFAYAHNEMKLSHQMLLQQPEVLTSREFRLRERHEFLKMLGRAQYDPEKDMYISPKALVEGNNHHFVRKVAKSDMETYELFLKSR